jgi:hypothetical protein
MRGAFEGLWARKCHVNTCQAEAWRYRGQRQLRKSFSFAVISSLGYDWFASDHHDASGMLEVRREILT